MAHGHGLQTPLRHIVVPADSGGRAWILRDDAPGLQGEGQPPANGEEYALQDLSAPPGYLAALAIQGPQLPVTFVSR